MTMTRNEFPEFFEPISWGGVGNAVLDRRGAVTRVTSPSEAVTLAERLNDADWNNDTSVRDGLEWTKLVPAPAPDENMEQTVTVDFLRQMIERADADKSKHVIIRRHGRVTELHLS